MRWAWVPCLACSPPDDARKAGATYKNLNLNEGDIARRAQLANTKASYTPQEPRPTLSRTSPGNPVVTAPAPSADAGKLAELVEQNKKLSERLDELLKQNIAVTDTLSRMSMQVASLLEDNTRLREQLSKPAGLQAEYLNPTTVKST
jgi:hypothetical protein